MLYSTYVYLFDQKLLRQSVCEPFDENTSSVASSRIRLIRASREQPNTACWEKCSLGYWKRSGVWGLLWPQVLAACRRDVVRGKCWDSGGLGYWFSVIVCSASRKRGRGLELIYWKRKQTIKLNNWTTVSCEAWEFSNRHLLYEDLRTAKIWPRYLFLSDHHWNTIAPCTSRGVSSTLYNPWWLLPLRPVL